MNFHTAFYSLAFLAHLPMLVSYARIVWAKGHYQFFPLLIAAAAWLAFERLNGTNFQPDDRSKRIALGLWILDGIVLSISALLYSSILAMPALMIGLAAYCVDRFGWAAFRYVVPIWLLLLLIAPPPANLDQSLIQMLQFQASQMASLILDAFGQTHFREGVTLITAQKQFFTEEACSGIRSLFSSLAAIAIYGIVRHYPWWRHTFNFAQTVIWVLAGNALRIALVVYVSDNWSDAIATGTNHEMLGLAVFVFIFALALSTDRAIGVLLEPSSNHESESGRMSETGATPPTSVGLATGANATTAVPFRWAKGLLMLWFGLVLVFSARLTYVRTTNEFSGVRFDNVELTTSQASDLPTELNGWKQVGFERKLRDEHSLLAPESFLWTFQRENRTLIISLDSPYHSFHDLEACYQGIGWQANSIHAYVEDGKVVSGLSTIPIRKPDQSGVVYFSAFTRTGQMIIPPEQLSPAARFQNIFRNINQAFRIGDANANFSDVVPAEFLPISQIQLLCEQPAPLSPTELDELKVLFEAARDRLLQSPRFKNVL